jgi:hypothetical protein
MKKNLNKVFMIIALSASSTIFCSQSATKVADEASTMVPTDINIELLQKKSEYNPKNIDTLQELYKVTQEAIHSTVTLFFVLNAKEKTESSINDAVAYFSNKNKKRFISQYLTICNRDPIFNAYPQKDKEEGAELMYEGQAAQVKAKLLKEFLKPKAQTEPGCGCFG